MTRAILPMLLLCAACSGVGSQPIGEVGYVGTDIPRQAATRTATPPAAALLPTAGAIAAQATSQAAQAAQVETAVIVAGIGTAQALIAAGQAGQLTQAANVYGLTATPAAARMVVELTAISADATGTAQAAATQDARQMALDGLRTAQERDAADFGAQMRRAREIALLAFLCALGVGGVAAWWRYLPALISAWVADVQSNVAYWRERRRVWLLKERVDVEAGVVYHDDGPGTLGGETVTAPDDAGVARIERARAWELAVSRFLLFGRQIGSFSQGAMEASGVVSRDGWDAITDWLDAAGVLTKRERSGTRWAAGWDLRRWGRDKDSLPLPYPDVDPPEVRTPEPAHSGAQAAQPA